MSDRFTTTGLNSQIYEEASAWFVEMRAGDVDAVGRQQFDAWVRKSPEHLRAYLEISEIWDDAPLVDKARMGSSDELVARAQAGAEVVAFAGTSVSRPESAAPEALRSLRTGARAQRWATAAAVGAVACALATLIGYQHLREPAFSTGIGEQRIVTLPDGTRVELNSRTRLTLHFTDRRRDVQLLEGQAMFTVAGNPQRPFVVRSRNLAVHAVGTAFDVDQKGNTTTVTVVDGRVAVRTLEASESDHSGSPNLALLAPILVDAGEQVIATIKADKPLRASRVNVAVATAWTHGELIFEGSRLADVIEEFNRHNERQIVLADPALGDMQISGVYASTDPSLFVRFMRQQSHVHIEETPSRIVISSM